MSKFIPFTEEQKAQANTANLEEYLLRHGEKLIPSGRDKRLANDHSITIRGNRWYDHSSEQGGGAISFMEKYYGLSFQEAVSRLLDIVPTNATPETERESDEKKEFYLPPSAVTKKRVFSYLIKTRGIDRNILTTFIHAGLIYEDKPYHNIVFVGMDENGVPRHAHKRSTNTKGKNFRQNVSGSDARYPFHWKGFSERLFVFEAPIDLLSFLSIYSDDWEQHSYVACCGVSIQPVLEMLKQTNAKEVYLCLDHDKAGQAAEQKMEAVLTEKGYSVHRLIPTAKDWNDDLIECREKEKTQCLTEITL